MTLELRPMIPMLTLMWKSGLARFGLLQPIGGGASSFDAQDLAWRKPWRLPAGTPYPDTLRLWNDDNPKGHWTFAPAYDMSLADFKAELAKVGPWEKLFP